jgi:hypothetical protein
MAAEDDVPLGDAARHYEEKFGEKVRQVRKPGAPPPGGPGGGSAAGRGALGLAAVIVIVVIRVLIGFGSSNSRHNSNPPPPPRIDFDQMGREVEQREDAHAAALRALMARQPLANLGPFARLAGDDVPLWEGLCYRISRDARQEGPTPGKRVMAFLDEAARDLVRRAAAGGPLKAAEDEELRAALNEVLERPDFYDEPSFHRLDLPAEARAVVARRDQGLVPPGVGDVRLLNRLALEAAYPAQVVPLRDRALLTPAALAGFRERARQDLEEARKQDAARR